MKRTLVSPEMIDDSLPAVSSKLDTVSEIFELMHNGRLSQQQASRALKALKRRRHSWLERYVKALAS